MISSSDSADKLRELDFVVYNIIYNRLLFIMLFTKQFIIEK